MDMITLIGFLAGGLTTASFVPQVVKTARTRSARDISEAMLLVFLAGLALWTLYGVQVGSLPIIAANVITIGLVGAILAMKVQFRNRECECTLEDDGS
ncbi:MAG TPA: SemiSWEET transporter [Methanomicrobiales archaeon]|nr:SemiSWEET transporter [Methanomicrobiales archaeon]